MTVADIGGIASIASLIVFPTAVVFASGRKAQKLEDHEHRILGLEEISETNTKAIGEHAVEIGKLTAWRDGYQAAVNSAHHE